MEVGEAGEMGATAMAAEEDNDMEMVPDITQEQFPSDMSMYWLWHFPQKLVFIQLFVDLRATADHTAGCFINVN